MDEMIFAREGRMGVVTLNRPMALNALSREMIGAMHRQLASWAGDPDIEIVAIEGSGGRALCSGGDVVSLYHQGRNDQALWEGYFRDEYRLDQAIAHYPVPVVALADGIVMGGGVGISIHAPYRVATENTLFAMPEPAIGMIPDVGSTHALPDLPGELGTWVALSGARIKGADAVHVGYATHYIPSAELALLKERLGHADETVEHILQTFDTANETANQIAPFRDAIDYHFGQDEVEEIVESLRQGDDWAQAQGAAMEKGSPTSLKLALHALREGASASIEEALRLEYRMVCAIRERDDFYEGVRAQLIDKDRQPKWQPASLAGVDIAPYLERPASGDLDFD